MTRAKKKLKKVGPVKKSASREKTVEKPQVPIVVGPGGFFVRWVINFGGDIPIKGGRNKEHLIRVARKMKNYIAESGGRAELIEKDRQGRIRKGPQGRDSGGPDPEGSEG